MPPTPDLNPAAVAALLAADPNSSLDEATVRPYQLPELLRGHDGRTVHDQRGWHSSRRGEVLGLFADHIYGQTPSVEVPVRYSVLREDSHALDGVATRTEVRCTFADMFDVTVMLYTPNAAAAAAPAFLGLNFWGNHTVDDDPHITMPTSWLPDSPARGVRGHRATASGRGCMAHRWPLRAVVSRGYALATACYADLCPDGARPRADNSGILGLLDQDRHGHPDHRWGAIGAWAWGMSRMLDYLAVHPAVDHRRVAVLGHSRLGKAALWAAAQDQRFAMVIANNSGCGGASLFRHTVGERLHILARHRGYWFCPRFGRYALAEHELPIDQHMLLALVAPRTLYVASATEDYWADPVGEYLALTAAAPVYALHGLAPALPTEQPSPDQPVTGPLAYHLRTGPHDVTTYDWRQFLSTADRVLR